MNNKYKNEIEQEYKTMREQINHGNRLPYDEYVKARTNIYITYRASREDLLEIKTRVEQALEKTLLTVK